MDFDGHRGPTLLADALAAVETAITLTEGNLPRLRRLAERPRAITLCGLSHCDLLVEAEARLIRLRERRERLVARLSVHRGVFPPS